MSEEATLTVEIEFQTGDILKFNDVWWEITNLPPGKSADMQPMGVGKMQNMGVDEIEERIDFSGELHLIRKDYTGVIDY